MERGCVEDQPQLEEHLECAEIRGALRLVEDDTAALRGFSNTPLPIDAAQGSPFASNLDCHPS